MNPLWFAAIALAVIAINSACEAFDDLPVCPDLSEPERGFEPAQGGADARRGGVDQVSHTAGDM